MLRSGKDLLISGYLNIRRGKRMTRRNKHMIISEILDICKTGACKTKIVYQANLNFRIVNDYIDLLIRNNLITVKQGTDLSYETTEKGISLLDNFKQISSQLSEL